MKTYALMSFGSLELADSQSWTCKADRLGALERPSIRRVLVLCIERRASNTASLEMRMNEDELNTIFFNHNIGLKWDIQP